MHLSTFSPRRLSAVAGMACTAALMPVASLAATGSTASAPRCATSGLAVWANADYGGGYAGGYYYTISFTNLSGHACTLQGYPGVSAVRLTGHQLGSPASWGSVKPPVVRLANGATATARLHIADTFRSPVTAAGLRVYRRTRPLPRGPDPVRRVPARRAGMDGCGAGSQVTGTAAAVAGWHAVGPRRRASRPAALGDKRVT
jgi:hypothetical protein